MNGGHYSQTTQTEITYKERVHLWSKKNFIKRKFMRIMWEMDCHPKFKSLALVIIVSVLILVGITIYRIALVDPLLAVVSALVIGVLSGYILAKLR